MWIHHPEYFLSIIDPDGAYGGGNGIGGDTLLVRARFKGGRVEPGRKIVDQVPPCKRR